MAKSEVLSTWSFTEKFADCSGPYFHPQQVHHMSAHRTCAVYVFLDVTTLILVTSIPIVPSTGIPSTRNTSE